MNTRDRVVWHTAHGAARAHGATRTAHDASSFCRVMVGPVASHPRVMPMFARDVALVLERMCLEPAMCTPLEGGECFAVQLSCLALSFLVDVCSPSLLWVRQRRVSANGQLPDESACFPLAKDSNVCH